MLEGAGIRLPDDGPHPRLPDHQRPEDVQVARHVHHGRGAISTSFEPEYLRYYYAAKLGAGIDDIDMNLDEFSPRVQFRHRGQAREHREPLRRIHHQERGRDTRGRPARAGSHTWRSRRRGESIAAAYEARDTAGAMREIMTLADRANQYIDAQSRGRSRNSPPRTRAEQLPEIQGICTQGLNLFRVLMIYLQPVLPEMAAKAQRLLRARLDLGSASRPVARRRASAYQPLATRLDPKAVARLIDAEAGAAARRRSRPGPRPPRGIVGESPPARARRAALRPPRRWRAT